ncbi:MAG: hypothetical protein NTY92_05775 [Nitrosospira sp.]|nr:hypothetical protein [Nitrosospira sp.]
MINNNNNPVILETAMTGITPALYRNGAIQAHAAIRAAIPSKCPKNPCGQNTCQAKNTAKLRITPTTAAVNYEYPKKLCSANLKQ